mgnify:CR=1 FL=1
MNHNNLTATLPLENSEWQEDDGWGAPSEFQSPEEISTSIESPKRQGLMKRLGEKAAFIAKKKPMENGLVDSAPTEQTPTEAEHTESNDTVAVAKEGLRIAEAELAKREEYFDSRQHARLPKADGSGFTQEIRKEQLSTYDINRAKYFDSQSEHFIVDRAQNALKAAQAKRDALAVSSWATPEQVPLTQDDYGSGF